MSHQKKYPRILEGSELLCSPLPSKIRNSFNEWDIVELLSDRNGKVEGSALAEFGYEPDVTSLQLDQLFGDV